MQNFEFYANEEDRKAQFFREFSGPGLDEALQDLERAILLYSDIVYFFKRKRSFYEKYKKLRLKNLDKQTGDGNVTVNDQKEHLVQLEKHIVEHNHNLVAFLEGSPLLKQTLDGLIRAVIVATDKLDRI